MNTHTMHQKDTHTETPPIQVHSYTPDVLPRHELQHTLTHLHTCIHRESKRADEETGRVDESPSGWEREMGSGWQ